MTLRTPVLRGAVTTAGLVLALAACGADAGTPVARDEPTTTPTATPTASGGLPPSYEFTFSAACYCPDTDVTYRVRVADGRVRSAVVDTVEPSGAGRDLEVGDPAPEHYRISIQDMLDTRGLSGRGAADEVDVTWPDGSDHPTRISVDRELNAIDDEVDYRILSFAAP